MLMISITPNVIVVQNFKSKKRDCVMAVHYKRSKQKNVGV